MALAAVALAAVAFALTRRRLGGVGESITKKPTTTTKSRYFLKIVYFVISRWTWAVFAKQEVRKDRVTAFSNNLPGAQTNEREYYKLFVDSFVVDY